MEEQVAQSARWFETVYSGIYHYITDAAMWMTVGKAVLKIILIIVLAKILIRVLTAAVNRIFKARESGKLKLDVRRMETMRSLVNNVSKYIIYFIAILSVLQQVGFNMGPLLASAGVAGLAIGFGAQNLVRDVITGFFIIFEDQFAVGDVVSTGKYSGTVQEIGLRITKIKGFTGELHIIPNGSITEVTNFSTQNSVAVVDISVAYEEDVEKVMDVLEEMVAHAQEEIEELVAKPNVLGVQNLGASEVVIRITAECRPLGNHPASRKLRSMIKKAFDEKGIEIPYPRLVTMPVTQKMSV